MIFQLTIISKSILALVEVLPGDESRKVEYDLCIKFRRTLSLILRFILQKVTLRSKVIVSRVNKSF
jgi:hypothetical protein